MENSSVNLLKSLNQKLNTGKGACKFPRRKTDFLFQDEQKFPLYPIENFISTVQHFSKSENIENIDNPVVVIRRITDYRDNHYEVPLAKSNKVEWGISFQLSGKKIKEAIDNKVAELKKKLAERKKLLGELNNTNSSVDPFQEVDYSKDWDVRNINGHIERLEAIARNINVSTIFKLSEYDLKNYGL